MFFRRFVGTCLIIAALTGCAAFGKLEEGLNSLVGRSESEAFSALGYPNLKQEFGGDVVYTWGRTSSGTLFIPQTSTTTGYVGNRPVYGTTTTNHAIPIEYNCTIKVIVNQGTVKTWEYDGNLGGCSGYINRINEYLKRL